MKWVEKWAQVRQAREDAWRKYEHEKHMIEHYGPRCMAQYPEYVERWAVVREARREWDNDLRH